MFCVLKLKNEVVFKLWKTFNKDIVCTAQVVVHVNKQYLLMSYTSDFDHSLDVFSAEVDCGGGGGVSLKCQVAVPSLLSDLLWVKERR